MDKVISPAALSKFCQHLWYLPEEIAALSLFDDAVDEETKVRIVANLERECLFDLQKKYFPTKEEISRWLHGCTLIFDFLWFVIYLSGVNCCFCFIVLIKI